MGFRKLFKNRTQNKKQLKPVPWAILNQCSNQYQLNHAHFSTLEAATTSLLQDLIGPLKESEMRQRFPVAYDKSNFRTFTVLCYSLFWVVLNTTMLYEAVAGSWNAAHSLWWATDKSLGVSWQYNVIRGARASSANGKRRQILIVWSENKLQILSIRGAQAK